MIILSSFTHPYVITNPNFAHLQNTIKNTSEETRSLYDKYLKGWLIAFSLFSF